MISLVILELKLLTVQSIVAFLVQIHKKKIDVKPISKIYQRNQKENDSPVSIFPTLSQLVEQYMQKQIYVYSVYILSKSQYRFIKGYNAQQCLISMI